MNDRVQKQLDELNKRFYAVYQVKYFEHALHLTLAGLVDPKAALVPLLEEQSIPGDSAAGILRIRITTEDLEEDDFRKSIKLQLVHLYHHSLETLLRLFLAHGPGIRCPWVEMARESSIPKFKKRVRDVRAMGAEWTGVNPEDEGIPYVFLPAEPTAERIPYLTAAKQWLNYAATATLDVFAYNSFRHGLAVSAGEAQLGWYPKGSDPRERDDAQPLIEARGDAIGILRRERQPDGSYHWMEETRWINVPELVMITWVAQKYIQAILTVGAARFAEGSLDSLWLPSYTPYEALKHGQKDGIRIDRFTIQLAFVEVPEQTVSDAAEPGQGNRAEPRP